MNDFHRGQQFSEFYGTLLINEWDILNACHGAEELMAVEAIYIKC